MLEISKTKMKYTHSYQIGKAITLMICSFIVVFMARKEIVRYFDNHDTSSVAIRKFNKTNDQNHQFPTFSICLFRGNVIYSSKEFMQVSGVSSKNVKDQINSYRTILEGLRPYNHEKIEKFPKFSSLTIQLKDLIGRFAIRDETLNRVRHWTYNNSYGWLDLINTTNRDNLPFIVSYQTTRLICFTCELELPNDITKYSDQLNFNKFALRNLDWRDNKNKAGWMNLYIHAKGQLIRNLDNPALSLNSAEDNFNGWHIVSVKRVDLLKGRQDSNTPCKFYPTNEDIEYLDTVVKEVGCVPVYWKHLNISRTDAPTCNATKEYRLYRMYNGIGYWPTPRHWIKLKWIPCYEMVVSSVLNTKDADNFRISIKYQDLGSRYFETVNSRDFGLENLLSSLGGIVGIFLGFSIMTIFEIISQYFVWIHDRCEKNNNP